MCRSRRRSRSRSRSRSRRRRGTYEVPVTPPGFWDTDGLTPPRAPSPSPVDAVAAGDQIGIAIAISAAIDRAMQRNAMLAARAAAPGELLK